MAYVTDGTLGIDLAATTAGTTTDGADAKFTLGKRVTCTDGSVWVYVQAGAAITQYYTVAIDENYVRQSILQPQAKIVKGYAGKVMPAFVLKDWKIDALIAYIKSVK